MNNQFQSLFKLIKSLNNHNFQTLVQLILDYFILVEADANSISCIAFCYSKFSDTGYYNNLIRIKNRSRDNNVVSKSTWLIFLTLVEISARTSIIIG